MREPYIIRDRDEALALILDVIEAFHKAFPEGKVNDGHAESASANAAS